MRSLFEGKSKATPFFGYRKMQVNFNKITKEMGCRYFVGHPWYKQHETGVLSGVFTGFCRSKTSLVYNALRRWILNGFPFSLVRQAQHEHLKHHPSPPSL